MNGNTKSLRRYLLMMFVVGNVVFNLSSAQIPDKVDAPVVHVGDTWTYQRVDVWKKTVEGQLRYDVTKATQDRSEVSITRDNATTTVNVYNAELNMIELNGKSMKPYDPIFSFPLTVGKTWEGTVSWMRDDGQGDSTRSMTSKVIGWEKVTVPAGTFDALRIESEGGWSSKLYVGYILSGEVKRTIWYSPLVRRPVRFEYRDTAGTRPYNQVDLELTAYKLVE